MIRSIGPHERISSVRGPEHVTVLLPPAAPCPYPHCLALEF
ncbi:hypothetical protein [Pseudonocardia zijingensis]